MSYLSSFISLILIHTSLIQKILSEATPAPNSTKGLGSSSCIYYGGLDIECQLTAVPVDKLPAECTSIIFDGLVVDSKNTVHITHGIEDSKFFENLAMSNKPVYSFYGRPNQGEWDVFFDGDATYVKDNAKVEMESLKTYLTEHAGLSGLILNNLYLYFVPDGQPVTENLVTYLEALTTAFPDLEIGLNVIAKSLIDWCTTPTNCVDFSKIDQYIDFYVINLINLNECTEEFKCSTSPMNGDSAFTMEMLTPILPTLITQKTKIHFLYRGSPAAAEFIICQTTYAAMCQTPPTNLITCADSQQSYVDKGKYAMDNGGGFIVENIDLIDPDCLCECDRPFPAFNFLLDGYNSVTTGKPCPKFNGNGCP